MAGGSPESRADSVRCLHPQAHRWPLHKLVSMGFLVCYCCISGEEGWSIWPCWVSGDRSQQVSETNALFINTEFSPHRFLSLPTTSKDLYKILNLAAYSTLSFFSAGAFRLDVHLSQWNILMCLGCNLTLLSLTGSSSSSDSTGLESSMSIALKSNDSPSLLLSGSRFR